VGAVFPTGSKADAEDVSYETLKAICEAVNIPVVAIGGISADNVLELKDSGISGIAVICDGGNNSKVKSSIIEVLTRLFGLSGNRISVNAKM